MSSISIPELTQFFKNFRNLFVPRSSYKTAGPAASELFHASLSTEGELSRLQQEVVSQLLKDKEYDTIKASCDFRQVDGHVVLLPFQSSADSASLSLFSEVKDLLLKKRSKVSFVTLPVSEEEALSSLLSASSELSFAFSKPIHRGDQDYKMVAFYLTALFKIRPDPAPFSLSFNQQPDVSTLSQFRFLWSQLSLPRGCPTYSADDMRNYKVRVLFRIASRSLHDGSKLSMEQWDDIISGILARGGDDYDIYSEIRHRVVGKTLREEFEILIGLRDDDSPADTKPQGEEDGRSDVLVDWSFKCLPYKFSSNPRKVNSGYTYLDYGCAEGSITEPLGKRLEVGRILGADVRSIVSNNFTFYQLPSEKEEEITVPSSILPGIPTGSVNIMTSAMVFHHVMHVESALTELYRISNKPNGCFLLREHDCESPGCGAFLDITHGLYSLSWNVPFEWPEFLTEYKACYRSREDWVDLLAKCGFTLDNRMNENQKRFFNGCKTTRYDASKNKYTNVIRAFYACFIPIPNFQFGPQLRSSNMEIVAKINTPFLHLLQNSAPASSTQTNTTNKEESTIQVFESKSNPGKFYYFEPSSKKAKWI